MPKTTSSTEPFLSLGAMTSASANHMPTLASALTRGSRREIEHRLEGARYHVGIDLGTTNSSVAVVDGLALLEGDTDGAVQVLPVRQETEDGTVTSPFLASVVAEVGPGEWWVGRGAREARSRGLLRGRQVFYSTKSEMGLGREPFYPFASSREYDSPWKVAGRILAELREAVEAEVGPEPLERAVVTVPASFQLAARKDTFRAAGLAGLTLSEQGLLDEPNAALLDWLLTCRPRSQDGRFFDLSHPRTILVFDFGGGTCDVSVLRAHADRDEQDLRLANLSIARYEQLGGDNIDAAIVERVLLPQLLRQNGLATLDLSFSEKQERVVPQLLSTAEALKLRLPGLPRTIQEELPARAGVPLRTLNLHLPTMSAAELEAVLAPFVDADCTYSRDTEMNRVSSVFGPIRDALRRARLDSGQVDAVLLVGGSALLPQVQEALCGFFPRAELLRFPDDARTLCGVARGAALHSFFLHGLGRPLLRPITQESLGILTRDNGYVELIPRGAELPFPADGKTARSSSLVVPRDLMRDVQIVVAAEGPDRVLGIEHLTVPMVRSAGEPIDLAWRLDGNKLLTVEATLPNHAGVRCEVRLENPLCSASLGSPRQQEIAELEDAVARAQAQGGNPAAIADRLERLAKLYVEEKKYERAIDRARESMEVDRKPSDVALNLMGISADRLGSIDRAEKYHREALAVDPGDPTHHFNLSLLLDRQDRALEALHSAEEAFRLHPAEGVYRGWRAILWRKVRHLGEAPAELRRAASDLDALASRDAWREYWRGRLADELGDRAWKARPRSSESEASGPAYDASLLPGQRGELARRAS